MKQDKHDFIFYVVKSLVYKCFLLHTLTLNNLMYKSMHYTWTILKCDDKGGMTFEQSKFVVYLLVVMIEPCAKFTFNFFF